MKFCVTFENEAGTTIETIFERFDDAQEFAKTIGGAWVIISQ